MRLGYLAAGHIDKFPEDVQAVLNLFPDTYELKSDNSGRYFDVTKDGEYLFYQLIGRTQEQINANVRRFVCWVREGMPEGYTGDYNCSTGTNNWWEREE